MSDQKKAAEKMKEISEETKQINPSTDKDNYVIQIVVDGKVIKEVIALNATVKVLCIGDQSLAADIR